MIQWSDEAKADLAGLLEWLNDKNPHAAAKVGEGIITSVERLETYPYLGRTGRRTGTRELIVTRRPYVVIYTVKASKITILRILHGAQLWPPVDENT